MIPCPLQRMIHPHRSLFLVLCPVFVRNLHIKSSNLPFELISLHRSYSALSVFAVVFGAIFPTLSLVVPTFADQNRENHCKTHKVSVSFGALFYNFNTWSLA